MKKFKLFIFLNLIIFISSCSTVKEGFTNQKKKSSDEFLVEKKSPLIMPPDYNELPIPKSEKNDNSINKNEIKTLISNSKKDVSISKETQNIDKNLEESLLEKIKKK